VRRGAQQLGRPPRLAASDSARVTTPGRSPHSTSGKVAVGVSSSCESSGSLGRPTEFLLLPPRPLLLGERGGIEVRSTEYGSAEQGGSEYRVQSTEYGVPSAEADKRLPRSILATWHSTLPCSVLGTRPSLLPLLSTQYYSTQYSVLSPLTPTPSSPSTGAEGGCYFLPCPLNPRTQIRCCHRSTRGVAQPRLQLGARPAAGPSLLQPPDVAARP